MGHVLVFAFADKLEDCDLIMNEYIYFAFDYYQDKAEWCKYVDSDFPWAGLVLNKPVEDNEANYVYSCNLKTYASEGLCKDIDWE